ncbi:hypothetical protein [Corallococcus llansteffanensis]|uniref:hypothetical protein n=1 Tax=Corallococcus llansteffanensis TaxID=2316731 RepID=UPI001ABF0ADD|nr:hypothetical protein [Corallococcus llansteffanensis]
MNPAVQAQTAQADKEEEEEEGKSIDMKELPFEDAEKTTKVFVQLLKEPTSLEEDVAVNVRLSEPSNPELADSLVRVVGSSSNPVVLFRSDALGKLGQITDSPGSDFFTQFARLPVEELERRAQNEKDTSAGKFGEVTSESLVFQGRQVVARTEGTAVSLSRFSGGALTPLSVCPLRPVSTQAAWGKALLITDPAVVQDSQRTWDPCTGAGTQGGAWTFAHLIRELANGSGKTPDLFVKDWLSLWLNNYTVNGDVVLARTAMYAQVIQPWANASGVSSALTTNPSTGRREVLFGGPLNLNISPFRLLAIVNRVDLSSSTGGGYGGSSSAGELRFVFGVTRPSPWGAGTEASCGLRPFTVIFEYGVPRSGCSAVIDWARQWRDLSTHSTFDTGYLTQLQTMTESVVLHGKAPSKGNQNALNQIRTNENTLNAQWELREFTLTNENPSTNTDTPASGVLRPHTVALTPDDATHNSNTDPDVSAFVLSTVRSSEPLPVLIPTKCSSSYSMPFSFNGSSFRGGNSLVRSPNFWRASGASSSDAGDVCARREFSLNTCNGCHFGDTGTTNLANTTNLSFTHISPTSGIPARQSKFLTGGGVGFMFSVADTQFGSGVATWQYADMERRYQRLFDLATCSTCSQVFQLSPSFLSRMQEIAGVVPFDPFIAEEKPPFAVGAIRSLDQVQKLLDVRKEFKTGRVNDAEVGVFQPSDIFVH